MSKPTYGELLALAARPRARRDAARVMLAAGSDPKATVGGVLAQAERDLARLNRLARPHIHAQRKAGYRRGRA